MTGRVERGLSQFAISTEHPAPASLSQVPAAALPIYPKLNTDFERSIQKQLGNIRGREQGAGTSVYHLAPMTKHEAQKIAELQAAQEGRLTVDEAIAQLQEIRKKEKEVEKSLLDQIPQKSTSAFGGILQLFSRKKDTQPTPADTQKIITSGGTSILTSLNRFGRALSHIGNSAMLKICLAMSSKTTAEQIKHIELRISSEHPTPTPPLKDKNKKT